MEIRKNDVLNFIRKVENSSQKSQSKQEVQQSSNASDTTNIDKNTLSFNKVRNKVLSIQSEVKNLQTNLSMNQTQLALLDTLKGKSNWSNQLTDAINKKFALDLKITELDAQKHKIDLIESNKGISAELSKKDIQMQNILSSGILQNSDAPELKVDELMQQIKEAKSTFSNLEPGQVKSLLGN